MSRSDIKDKSRGLMVGTAVGDCLGRPIEGNLNVGERYIQEILTSPPKLLYTDDTAMTMGLVGSLLDRGGFSGPDMARRFAQDYRDEPHRGYGANVVDVFENVLEGAPWDQAAASQFGGEGSYGNGAAMRVAPVAVWAFPDVDEAVRLAEETARVTHTHPVGVEGAVIQAVAACHALRDDFDSKALLHALDSRVETEEFRAKLDILPSCLERDDDERAILHLGHWVSARNSVVTALYCFLLSDGFQNAIVRAIRLGGDTDTIGAMAGALAGARYGYREIPDIWLEVEALDRLIELGDELALRPRS